MMTLFLLLSAALGAEAFDGKTFYFGDLHAHTGVSPDGWASDVDSNGNGLFDDCLQNTPVCGSVANVFNTAIADGLDFVALTDHNNANATAFNALLARVITYDSLPLVAIPAVELNFRSTTAHLGHKNLYIFQDNPSILSGLSLSQMGVTQRSNGACATDIWSNAATLNSTFGPTLMFAHHPASADVMTTSWACHNQTYEPVVEVYGGWGDAMTLSPGFDPTNTAGTQAFTDDAPESQATIHEALQTFGLKVGFVGGTDLHDTRPGQVCDRATTNPTTGHYTGGGLTMLAIPTGVTFNRLGIYNELVARRSMVTSGPRIPVDATWHPQDGSTHQIGEELTVYTGQTTTVSVNVPVAYEGFVQSVTAIGYSTTFALTETAPGVWSTSISDNSIPSWLYLDVKVDGAAFYGSTTICDDGGTDNQEHIWTSPEFFTVTAAPDADGDGYPTATDCNDSNASIHPGATEVCDGVDNDCNGTVDVGAVDATAYYSDSDADGYGAGTSTLSCSAISGKVTNFTDCNDTNAAVHPGATEVCNSLDDDCNGTADADAVDMLSFYVDSDGDSYGTGTAVIECFAGTGWVLNNTDCNDSSSAAHPGGSEVCDGVDNDCNGTTDVGASNAVAYFTDADGDGFGAGTATYSCSPIAGKVTTDTDCNDAREHVYPGAHEIVGNGHDENCNGSDND